MMTFKTLIVATGTSLALLLSSGAWAADMKDMATDMAKDQATDMVKDQSGSMMPDTDAGSASSALKGASDAKETAEGAATLQKAVGGSSGDMTDMAKDKAMEMGKDHATDAVKKMVE